MSNGQTVRQHDELEHGVDAYAVPCPLCEATVDELCTAERGGRRIGAPHNVRVLAAQAAEDNEASIRPPAFTGSVDELESHLAEEREP